MKIHIIDADGKYLKEEDLHEDFLEHIKSKKSIFPSMSNAIIHIDDLARMYSGKIKKGDTK